MGPPTSSLLAPLPRSLCFRVLPTSGIKRIRDRQEERERDRTGERDKERKRYRDSDREDRSKTWGHRETGDGKAGELRGGVSWEKGSL